MRPANDISSSKEPGMDYFLDAHRHSLGIQPTRAFPRDGVRPPAKALDFRAQRT